MLVESFDSGGAPIVATHLCQHLLPLEEFQDIPMNFRLEGINHKLKMMSFRSRDIVGTVYIVTVILRMTWGVEGIPFGCFCLEGSNSTGTF